MFTLILTKNSKQHDASDYRSLTLNTEFTPSSKGSFCHLSKITDSLTNLLGLVSEFHIVFLLSKSLDLSSCMKGQRVLSINSHKYKRAVCFLHVVSLLEELVLNSDDLVTHYESSSAFGSADRSCLCTKLDDLGKNPR